MLPNGRNADPLTETAPASNRRASRVLVWIGFAAVLASSAWSATTIASHRSGRSAAPEAAAPEAAAEAAVAAGNSSTSPTRAPGHAKLYPQIAVVSDVAGGNDVWYVLDATTPTVHMVGADGAWLGAFGRKGEGPGELLWPVAVAVGGDAVAVADARRQEVHVYDALDGTYRNSRRIETSGCTMVRPVDIAARETTFLLLLECMSVERPAASLSFERQVAALDDGAFRPLARRRPDAGTMDFGATYVLSEHPRGFVFGDAQDDCLGVYDLDGAQLDRACHDWLVRTPLPAGKRRELETAFKRRSSLVSVRIPDSVPAFDRVFWDDERLVYRVLQEEGSHLAARGGEGGAEALGGVPAAPWLFVASGTALAAWDEVEGARIALYPLS